jgi:hypothetical protein
MAGVVHDAVGLRRSVVRDEVSRMPAEDETLVVSGIRSYRNFVVGRRGVYYQGAEKGHPG